MVAGLVKSGYAVIPGHTCGEMYVISPSLSLSLSNFSLFLIITFLFLTLSLLSSLFILSLLPFPLFSLSLSPLTIPSSGSPSVMFFMNIFSVSPSS